MELPIRDVIARSSFSGVEMAMTTDCQYFIGTSR